MTSRPGGTSGSGVNRPGRRPPASARVHRSLERQRADRTVDAVRSAPRQRRRTLLTGRAAILAVVIAALAIALAAPLRQLIGQRAQIAGLRSSVQSQKQQVAALQKQQKLWLDPAYVASQAEQRLHYVRPGQVPYITLGPSPAAAAVGAPAATNVAAQAPWYAELWTSVQGAGKVTSRPVLPKLAATRPSVSPSPRP